MQSWPCLVPIHWRHQTKEHVPREESYFPTVQKATIAGTRLPSLLEHHTDPVVQKAHLILVNNKSEF